MTTAAAQDVHDPMRAALTLIAWKPELADAQGRRELIQASAELPVAVALCRNRAWAYHKANLA